MITAQNLVKKFGQKLAVDDVSFSVERGEVLGFLGPNGAGKSTTMRMITGFLPPTSGTVSIGGHPMDDQGIKARSLVGYLPENAPGYPEMTVAGFLHFAAELRGIPKSGRNQAVDKVVETCFLEPVYHQSIETLSKGYRHRVCLAQTLLHDPPVLVLDEPTDGLDPNQKYEVRNLIKRMGQEKAIIISTHILEEVDAVCSRVIIIDQGKLVFNGTPHDLRAKSENAGSVVLRLGLGESDGDPDGIRAALGQLPGVRDVLVLDKSAGELCLQARSRDRERTDSRLAAAVGTLCRERGWQVQELRTDPGRLDEVFRSITRSDAQIEEGSK
jgi:ABC-2 type transport system ATP-binding protein